VVQYLWSLRDLKAYTLVSGKFGYSLEGVTDMPHGLHA